MKMTNQVIIEVNNITKEFRTPVVREGKFASIRTLFTKEYQVKEAVRGISFNVRQGEFVGYIGPNGAGKSTTIKMMTGILHPSSGEIRIGGLSPHQHRRKVVANIGVVFGQRSQLWWDLPVKDSYDILAQMYKVHPEDKLKRMRELSELLDLHEFWTTPVRKLSLGQRMRADLAASLLHDPDILFLDEPTIGLDISAKRNIRQFLKRINFQLGKTILLTTHDMDDIEQLCNRVIVIGDGQLTYDGTIEQLREAIGLPTLIRVTFSGPFHVPGEQSTSLPITISVTPEASIQVLESSAHSVTVRADRRQIKAMDILRELSGWGIVEDVHMEEPDFEDIIRQIY